MQEDSWKRGKEQGDSVVFGQCGWLRIAVRVVVGCDCDGRTFRRIEANVERIGCFWKVWIESLGVFGS